MLSVMREQDIPECAGLFTAVYTAPPWNNAGVTARTAARYIGDMARAPGFLGFVYRIDDVLIGMILGAVSDYFFEPQYKIEEFAVDAARRREGLGTEMLEQMEAALAGRGVAYVTLETSADIPAYDFYIKNNYERVERNVFMAKALKQGEGYEKNS